MMKYEVIASRLNVRRVIPMSFEDKSSIAAKVFSGFQFDGEEVPLVQIPNPALGKWYRDVDGFFYWGGGIKGSEVIPVGTSPEVIGNAKDWGFVDFKIDELWKLSKGENIRVAILDSGLNFTLNDFINKTDIIYYNPFLDSDKKEDCLDNEFLHGTNCAGMLCAEGIHLWGVAPEIVLIIIKVTNLQGEYKTKEILKGLDKAIALNADIISLSFSMSKDDNFELIHRKIKEAYNRNITILAAAGDSGGLNFPVDNFPASFPECLSIGGVTRSKNRSKASTKSNFLDLMGPGEDLSSVNNSDIRINGTSFSAPFVAGTIALLKAIARDKNVPLDNIRLFDILMRSADRSSISNYNTIDHGWGLLDPVKSLNMLLRP